MLDSSIKINMKTPATGIIQRSSEKSFFVRCHQNSQISDHLFSFKPKYECKDISILQVMLIDENYMLIEAVFNEENK